MGKKGRETFEKRRLEKQRQEKQAAKRERRQTAQEIEEGPDQDELMERYRVLSEQYAAGSVEVSAYESERHEILVALGLEDPDESDGSDE